MKNETLKVIAWTLGRLAMYSILLIVLISAIAVGVTYVKYGSLVNLWEMPINNGGTYLGEVLGAYTSQHDLFLMPNRDAMSFDLLVVLFAFAFVIATGLTLQDCYKKYLSETNQ